MNKNVPVPLRDEASLEIVESKILNNLKTQLMIVRLSNSLTTISLSHLFFVIKLLDENDNPEEGGVKGYTLSLSFRF